MDFLLLAVALSLLLLAGFGFSRLLLPGHLHDQARGGGELFALSFLLGSSLVSLSLFVFGFFITGAGLRWLVTGLCVALGWMGWRRQDFAIKLRDLWPESRAGKLLLVVNVIQVAIVGWLCSVRVLGWDGLFNFEVKARLAFLNGGVIPLNYFSDPTRTWTLQSYPLLLPLTESWLYLWIGRADQELVKIVFLLFFIAGLCLLNAGNRLLGVGSWRRLIAPLLIFTAPLLIIGDGSASSGYADFPMAVFYLAAVVYLTEFWQSGNYSALRATGAMAACGCWLKQDGAILWLCMMALAVITLMLNRISIGSTGSTTGNTGHTGENKVVFPVFPRDPRGSNPYTHLQTDLNASYGWIELAKAALPGLFILVGWQLFVRFFSLREISQFSPISVSTLRVNLWRVPVVAQAVLSEMINWRHWGVFWLVAISMILWMFWRDRTKLAVLPLALLLPLGLYSGVYIFSIWPSFITHLESSFPRLLIHLSLVAALSVAAAMRSEKIEHDSSHHT